MKSLLVPAAALLLTPAFVNAQTPGTYEAFGSGCGSTGKVCNGHDPKGMALYASTLPNEYAMPFKVTSPTPASGLRFYTKSTGGTHTVLARIFKADCGGPASEHAPRGDTADRWRSICRCGRPPSTRSRF